MRRRIQLISVMLLLVTSLTFVFAGCGGKTEAKESYTVTYNLNYDNVENRVVSVDAGSRAIRWRPYRDGYTLEEWYKDSALTKKFEFDSYIYSDIELHAKWAPKPGVYKVEMHLNYNGAGSPKVIEVNANQTIDKSKTPANILIGSDITGWYKDEQCTQEWNFETDVVSADTKLYAGYKKNNIVPRDAQGNVVYQGVTVDVWIGSDFGYLDIFEDIKEQFNSEYQGKIKVNISTGITSQDSFSLRLQQTPGKNINTENYYTLAQVYELAGLEYGLEDWYANVVRDSVIDGQLGSVPLFAGVPYYIYNKTLMQRYNGNNALPSDYNELMALLKIASVEESKVQPSFQSVVTNRSWTFKEAASYVSFIQNAADYYTYENGTYVSKWGEEEVFGRALIASQNLYNLFGKNGEAKGYDNRYDNEFVDDNAINKVKSGNSLMGLVNIPGSSKNIAGNSELGILPLSGLFTSLDTAQKDQIPVHTVGFQFYKAKNISYTQLAAASVFADYVSKNTHGFTREGWYPIRKSVVESEDFLSDGSDMSELLLQVGSPENFRTLDGYARGKSIFNDNAATQFIVPMLDGEFGDIGNRLHGLKYNILSKVY